MHTYASSRVKRKNFYGKSELLLISILVDSFCPTLQSSTKVRTMFRQITQKLWAIKTRDFGKLFTYQSFTTFHFFGFSHWAVSTLFFWCRVYCVTVKTKNLEHHKTLVLVSFFSPKTIKEKIESFILSKSLRFQVAGELQLVTGKVGSGHGGPSPH